MNNFTHLDVDHTEDNSTTNVKRKIEKLRRKQDINYCPERQKKIDEYDDINKRTNKPKKSKPEKKKESDEDVFEYFKEIKKKENKNYEKIKEEEERKKEIKRQQKEEQKRRREEHKKNKPHQQNHQKHHQQQQKPNKQYKQVNNQETNISEEDKIKKDEAEQDRRNKIKDKIEHQDMTKIYKNIDSYINQYKGKYKLKEIPTNIEDFLKQYNYNNKMYVKLCSIYHPDKGGKVEYMQIINDHKRFKTFKY